MNQTFKEEQMAIVKESDDLELRTLIHSHDQVIVKFIDDKCEICKELAPKYEEMANEKKYKSILFLRIDAKENPVSSKEVKVSGTPFFAIYKKGRLIECGLIEEASGIKHMLEQLLTAS